MILNQSQAEAAYTAMLALKKLGGYFDAVFPADDGKQVLVHMVLDGSILVRDGVLGRLDRYENPSAFARAYGLIEE